MRERADAEVGAEQHVTEHGCPRGGEPGQEGTKRRRLRGGWRGHDVPCPMADKAAQLAKHFPAKCEAVRRRKCVHVKARTGAMTMLRPACTMANERRCSDDRGAFRDRGGRDPRNARKPGL